jgi:hypothetical protein
MGTVVHQIEVTGEGDVKALAHVTDTRDYGVQFDQMHVFPHRHHDPTITDDETAQRKADEIAADLQATIAQEPVSEWERYKMRRLQEFATEWNSRDDH